jgi:hypothetical protein
MDALGDADTQRARRGADGGRLGCGEARQQGWDGEQGTAQHQERPWNGVSEGRQHGTLERDDDEVLDRSVMNFAGGPSREANENT